MCHVAFDPLVLSPAAALRAKKHLEDEKLIRALGSYAGTSAFNVDIRAEQTLRVLIKVLKIKKSKTKKLLRGSRARLRRSSFPHEQQVPWAGVEREVTKWLSNLLATCEGRRATSLSQRRDDAKANLTQLVKDVMTCSRAKATAEYTFPQAVRACARSTTS
jgi:hypothetical protein